MFNQQQHAVAMTNTAQTSPTGKKANAKRKNNQQIANNVSPNQPNKQPSFSMSQGSLSANGIMPPQQHYQVTAFVRLALLKFTSFLNQIRCTTTK